MKSGGAWNTRPFRPETLEAAREAARRAGLSLAQWLNSAIPDTAADAGVGAARRGYETGDPDDPLVIIGERLDELARRIDRPMRRGYEPDPWHSDIAPNRSAPEIGAALRAIETRLDAIARGFGPQREGTIERLVGVIRDLNSKLDRLGTSAPSDDVAPHRAVDRAFGLAEEDRAEPPGRAEAAGWSDALAEISTRQRELDAGIAGARDFSRLEDQLLYLTEQIEALRGPAEPAAFGRIEGRILELTQKLEALRRPAEPADTVAGGMTASERIERKLLELAQKLDAADVRLGGLSDIERSIAALMVELKTTRADAAQEAERTVRAVATELLRDAATAGTEIDTLKQEFVDFRTSRTETDQRTEQALEALHDTLERLVDRLATIETGVRVAADVQQSSAAFGPRAPAPPPRTAAPAPALRGSPSDLPADHPLEPGSGPPQGRTVPPPPTRSAATGPALSSPAAAEPATKPNFIAAARRAAQAAAAESGDPRGPARPQPKGGLGAAIANRRRPLLIAAGVLLIGAAGVHFGLDGELPALLQSRLFASWAAWPAAPAAGGSAAALAPDPIVPESAPGSTHRPTSAAGDEFLLSPVPTGAMMSTPAAAQAPESIPSPAPGPAASEGPVSVPEAEPAAIQDPRADAPPAAKAAGQLPNAIGSAALRSAALAGNPAAAYEVGLRFSEGRGVPQSFEEAAHWFARAAEHGVAPAQYRLGSLYEKGQGVKRDPQEARRLYLAAAQQGSAKAMHNLAVLYAVGLEGTPDYKAASEWFRKAADHGLADSQYNLGVLYARGVGVEQNLSESYKWFALAAQQGDKDAGKKRDEVAGRLDPQALIAAKLAVQTFTVDPEPEQATKVELPADKERALPITPPAKSKSGRRTGASGSV